MSREPRHERDERDGVGTSDPAEAVTFDPGHRRILRDVPGAEVWVFGHGSLMFRPGFDAVEARWARVEGFQRRFGHPSIRNWGTTSAPGPTCCLVPGGSVDGVAFRLGADADAVLAGLRRREAGPPTPLEATSAGVRIGVLTWLMDDAWADLPPEELVLRAVANREAGGGPSGDAFDYLAGVAGSLGEGPGLDAATASYVAAMSSRDQ